MTDIAQRLTAAASHLENLKARQATAMLDGDDFNPAEVVNAEAELAALRDAQSEQVRRQRHTAAQARQQQKTERKSQLQELAKKRTEALQGAEEGARQLAAEVGRAIALNKEMVALAHEISGEGTPGPLSALEFPKRLSNRLSAVMKTVPGHPQRLGNIPWMTTTQKQDESWAAEEARILEPHLKSILEK
ncbi:hypothetical protein [Roseibium salinum]|uniref:Uncharacterized protein n=1 Tax=Roseibium salinum TaxID=1604349 RepID=A0ABT3QYE5_9HYPH|nr:hypothetical protein [Roseibium sp. DSM 29163]MCX2721969.1 hypothetical protein [Roseibium sp. DSM 29163]MDN3719999.1 hypothetical protein [Roseibium salinum]